MSTIFQLYVYMSTIFFTQITIRVKNFTSYNVLEFEQFASDHPQAIKLNIR